MKKLIALSLFFFWGALSTANAQFGYSWGSTQSAEHFILEYGEQLALTDDQKAGLLAAGVERRENMQRQRMRHNRPQNRWRSNRGTNNTRHQQSRGESRAENVRQSRNENNRGADYQPRTPFYHDILTEEQISALQAIRIEKAERQYEVRQLRTQIAVERTELNADTAQEVIRKLNRVQEIRKDMHVQHIQNPGEQSRSEVREALNEIRDAQNSLKHLLTAAEYEKLQRQLSVRPQAQPRYSRAASRGMMRSR